MMMMLKILKRFL